MFTTSRRGFLGTAAGIAAAGWPQLRADPLGMPIGCQTWPVRDQIKQDFPGTLKQLAAVGYKSIEMCSPAGYVDSGFGGLVKYKGDELRRIINDAGLRCESSHFGPGEIKERLEERIAWAKDLGLKQMILASFGLHEGAKVDDWKRAAESLNKAGEQANKAGIQMGYHNHDSEFDKMDGVLVYDELLKTFDPKLVKLQFQVAVIRLGFKAETYLSKYPGRYISMHLADWKPGSDDALPVGKGIVDWPKLFAAAKTAGVRNYFAEVNDMQGLKDCYPYLHSLKV